MRLYTARQILFRRVKVEGFTFHLRFEEANEYEDWVVAGVKFDDYQERMITPMITINIYKFGVGFKCICIDCHTDAASKTINIILEVRDAPHNVELEENAGDKFVADLIRALANDFEGQPYKDESKDILSLVATINSPAEVNILEAERKSLRYAANFRKIVGVALAVLAGYGLWRMLKKQ